MRIKTNIVKLLAVLAIIGSLVAIAAVPAFAATATLSANHGAVGDPITVTGTDYNVNSVLTVKFDGVQLATSPATVTVSAATTTFTFVIPVTYGANTHTVAVYQDGINPITTTGFTVDPKIVVSPIAAQPGASITVTGTGFSNLGVTVTVMLGTSTVASGVTVDSTTGSFSTTGATVPATAVTGTLVATDGAGKSASTAFTVTPTLVLTPTSGLPGSTVAVTGSGWGAAAVTLTFAGASVVTTPATITPTSGLISATFTVPSSGAGSTPGVKAVVASQGATTATANFTVSARALTITPNSGAIGTTVVIIGSTLSPSATITMGGPVTVLSPSGAITTDSTGTMVPVTARINSGATLGANTITATDPAKSAAGVFTVVAPKLSVSPTSGPRNSVVTFTGTGWVPNVQVTITLAGGSVLTTPDATGSFAAILTVPEAASNTLPNTATAIDGLNTATTTFTVPPAAITVTPDAGAAGTTVTVSGTGFPAYTQATIQLGTIIFDAKPLTNALGTFSQTIVVLPIQAGITTVSATTATTGTLTKLFTVVAAPPTVASALSTISSQLVRVWGYSNGTWSMYDPSDAAGSNLATLVPGSGYWLNVNAACTLISGGYSYALSTGWNLMGWR